MITTLFLAKFFGLFMLLTGVALVFNWKNLKSMVDELIISKGLLYFVAMLELLGGLAIVLSHYVWDNLLTSLISIIGILMIIEAIFYIIVSNKVAVKVINFFNKKYFYIIGGLIWIMLGIYFTYNGFFV